jgi:hypothetical protein
MVTILRTQVLARLRAGEPALHAAYHYKERVSGRGWNIRPSPLLEPRLLRPWYTRQDHVTLAVMYLELAVDTSRRHVAAIRRAENRYGDYGALISGGFRDHWPDRVKDRIRVLARASGDLSAAAFAHWAAAGRRPHTLRRLRDTLEATT